MSTNLTGTFDTRREAEMTVERLVQEHGIERTDIFIAAAGAENTAGIEEAGSDNEAGSPSTEDRDDPPLNGAVSVSGDITDDAKAQKVRAAIAEFGGERDEAA